MRLLLALAVLLTVLLAGGCDGRSSPDDRALREFPPPASPSPTQAPALKPKGVELTFAAFSLAREAYESRLVSEFQSHWRKAHQQDVSFKQSYGGSGSQSRAVAGGTEADIVALSLDQDVDALVHAGLVRSDWKNARHGGTVTASIVVFAVRKGNPLAIRDWADLVRPGLRIVNANPNTSGAGRWNLSAVYGAALRGSAGVPAGDAVQAQRFVAQVLANVVVQEKDAETSFKAFAAGQGDVALASESQVNRGRMFGNDYEAVVPRSTLRIDNPVAVVDANADKHGAREVAEAFVEFLLSSDAQRAFAFYGFRSVDPSIAQSYAQQFPSPADLFTIDDLGGWDRIARDLFAPGAVVERATKAPPIR